MRQFLGLSSLSISPAKVCRVCDTIGLLYLKEGVGGTVDFDATGRLGLLKTQLCSSRKWQRTWNGGCVLLC